MFFLTPSQNGFFLTSTRRSAIAVVRRFFKMGPKMVERRLKTVRRLFHPLPVEMCAMLISDDAYFSFFHFTSFLNFFLNRAERGKCFCVDPVWTLKKCAMLKNFKTLIQFLPLRDVRDAYFQRRQLLTGEYKSFASPLASDLL